MICRNAKNCVRMTGLVAGITFGAVRTAVGSCGGCRADANGGQESDKSIAVRHSLVKSRESSLCGPEPPPAEARKRAPQAPPRKFLRIRRSAGTDFARGKQLQNPAFGWVPVRPGNFFEPLLDPRIYAHPALDRSIPRVTAGILVVRSAESSGLILRRAPGAAGRCC